MNPAVNINPPPRFTDGPCQDERIEPAGPVDAEFAQVWKKIEGLNILINHLTDKLTPYLTPAVNTGEIKQLVHDTKISSPLAGTVRLINDKLAYLTIHIEQLYSRIER